MNQSKHWLVKGAAAYRSGNASNFRQTILSHRRPRSDASVPSLGIGLPHLPLDASLTMSPCKNFYRSASTDEGSRDVGEDGIRRSVEYLGEILSARVYDAAEETMMQKAHSLSKILNNKILLKREDMQPVFSFKIRGAYNKMVSLTSEQLSTGVVACSAGNHAQGVAMSARMLGCRAVIVMPVATPAIKVNSVAQHGGATVEVRLHGNNYDEAAAEANRLIKEEGLSLVHPFDDPHVIAGQGTIGMEILQKCVSEDDLDSIFVCCGGGGMLAGVAAYVKRVRPGVRVIGVEAADAAGMTASIKEGRVVTLDSVGLFADGAAVKTVGKETFRICNKLVDDMVTVTTDQICEAIKLSYNDARVVLEPAGALGVAGMKKYIEEMGITGKTFVAITSGANMDFARLRFVSERSDASERMLAVNIPERPGSFRHLYSLVWPRNVTEFSYRFESEEQAKVMLSFQPKATADKTIESDFYDVMEGLRKNDFECYDISENELAKVHGRHLAGGRSNSPNERVFRFNFPESPGALKRFLNSLDFHWNISMFHYRNHGDDSGRVLVGIQTQQKCGKNLIDALDKLGYPYYEETDNPVYRGFLRSSRENSITEK
mmetsp:Transcript_42039/g.98493  ORF Transcript_42039/g.98493 Transcript_42039/m.98493 type:complete len:603 (-) Transcript_42039:170-1978(-)